MPLSQQDALEGDISMGNTPKDYVSMPLSQQDALEVNVCVDMCKWLQGLNAALAARCSRSASEKRNEKFKSGLNAALAARCSRRARLFLVCNPTH